ncbi:MAG: hypothetical protein GX811_04415 [Lentisphaerae bacterium]|jgi:hypothetical protein|nr:hypothetical protein [Lentisphaerota bacterium]
MKNNGIALLLVTVMLTGIVSVFTVNAEDKQPGPMSGQQGKVIMAPAEFMKKAAESNAKMLEIKKSVSDRREKLYESNPSIKTLWAEMVAMQKEINSILEADAEYNDLILKRDILNSVLPETSFQPFRNPKMPQAMPAK